MNRGLIFLLLLLVGCSKPYDAKQNLSKEEYALWLNSVAPYVIKKPDHISYEDRTKPEYKAFYDNFIKETGGELRYAVKTDTANIFFFSHRDHTSLYEHYRGLGGYFKTDSNGHINYIMLLYHTPRFTKEEMEARGQELFKEMVSRGHVSKFIGNRQYIHTPNKDFFYNDKINRWDYTENSSWKFLEEAKQAADSAMLN